jgi:GDP-D-mannose dehydratase
VCSGQPFTLEHVIKTLEEITQHRMEIKVNPAFVRANEVHRLCGSPAKLVETIGPLLQHDLADTLSWMLKE